MEEDIFNLKNKIYSNNNNILLEIINDLQQIINYCKYNKIIKRISDIIIKMNSIINENKKNTELLRKDISILYNKFSKQLNNLIINNMNYQEIKYNNKNGRKRYIGQVLNGIPEGKGTMHWNNGDRYEGEWKNNKKEGRGIYYLGDGEFKGDRYEGDYKNGKAEEKGIYYYANGDRYEGEFKNGKREGKGIYYFANGDRTIVEFLNDKPIGKHVKLTINGEVEIENY